MGLLTNTKNTQRINGLLDDLHEAFMDYQVCTSNCSFFLLSDICARLHSKKTSITRVVGLL